MGLMEKAFHYKTEINKRGEKTLIDLIDGPARTGDKVDEGLIRNGEKAEINDIELNDVNEKYKKVVGNANQRNLVLKDEDTVADVQGNDDVLSSINIDDQIVTNIVNTNGEYASKIKIHDIKGHEQLPDAITESLTLDLLEYLIQVDTKDQLLKEVIFHIMGQIAVSSASVLWKDRDTDNKWKIIYSEGITLSDEDRNFSDIHEIFKIVEIERDILDLDKLSGRSDLTEEYIKFIGADGRFLIPMVFDEKVSGVILIGEKISQDELTEDEKMVLKYLVQFSSHVLNHLIRRDENFNQMKYFSEIEKARSSIDSYLREITSVKKQENIYKLLESLLDKNDLFNSTVYLKDYSGDYVNIMFSLSRNMFVERMQSESTIIKEINKVSDEMIVDDNLENFLLQRTDINHKNNKFSLLPFVFNNNLLGFIVYSKGDTIKNYVAEQLSKTIILPLYFLSSENSRNNQHADLFSPFIEKFNQEIVRAKSLDIPLSLGYFSLRNLRRYYSTHGPEFISFLMKTVEETITHKLSEGDSSVRFDMNKFLLILPGKTKKYSVSLCNTIRNDIISKMTRNDVQVLISIMCVTYPDDGLSSYELFDQLQ